MAFWKLALGVAGLISSVDAARRASALQNRALQEQMLAARRQEMLLQQMQQNIAANLLQQRLAQPTGTAQRVFDEILSETSKMAALASGLYPQVPGLAQNITLRGLLGAKRAQQQVEESEQLQRTQALQNLLQQSIAASQVMSGAAANIGNQWAQLANATAQTMNPAAFASTIPQFASLIEQNLSGLRGLLPGRRKQTVPAQLALPMLAPTLAMGMVDPTALAGGLLGLQALNATRRGRK